MDASFVKAMIGEGKKILLIDSLPHAPLALVS